MPAHDTASEQNPAMSYNGSHNLGFTTAGRVQLLGAITKSADSPAQVGTTSSLIRSDEPNTGPVGDTSFLPDWFLAPRVLSSKRRRLSLLDEEGAAPVSSRYVVQGMEKWSAVVTGIDEDLFTAELIPESPESPRVEADFPFSAVSPEDVDLLEVGAGFYVTVRTVLDGHVSVTRTSALRFRRLGRWTEADAQELRLRAQQRADRLRDAID